MTHTSTEQPEALRLADRMEWYCVSHTIDGDMKDAAKELRRLHARVQELEAEMARLIETYVPKSTETYAQASQVQRVPLSAKQRRAIFDDLYPHGAFTQTWQNFSVIVGAVEKYLIAQEKKG